MEYLKIDSVNPLHFVCSKVKWYFEEINGNKFITLIRSNESNEKTKRYEERWRKIGYLIRFITKISDDDYQK